MAKREFTYKFTAQVPNDYGFGVLTEGIDLSRFKLNPVVLKNHNINEPVGTAEILSIEPNGDATVKITIDDENDQELQKLCRDIDKKLYNGISMGLDCAYANIQYGVEGFAPELPVFIKSEMLELSLTPLPGNKECLRLFNNGKELKPEEMRLQLTALQSDKPQTTMNKLLLMMVSMGIFKLNAKATEEDAMAALQNVANDFSALETLRTEKKTLEDENKALKLSRNTSLVKDAVAANKIKAEDEPMYLELVNSNYESTKKILDGIKPHISLSSRTNGASGAEGSEDKYKGWNMDRFRKEAPLELARIRKEEPDRFKQLFNEKFAKQ